MRTIDSHRETPLNVGISRIVLHKSRCCSAFSLSEDVGHHESNQYRLSWPTKSFVSSISGGSPYFEGSRRFQ